MRRFVDTVLAILAALTMSGCAITSSHPEGPNGRPVHFIDAMTASKAYDEARRLCPSGYSLIGEPRLISAIDYVMTVECR